MREFYGQYQDCLLYTSFSLLSRSSVLHRFIKFLVPSFHPDSFYLPLLIFCFLLQTHKFDVRIISKFYSHLLEDVSRVSMAHSECALCSSPGRAKGEYPVNRSILVNSYRKLADQQVIQCSPFIWPTHPREIHLFRDKTEVLQTG